MRLAHKEESKSSLKVAIEFKQYDRSSLIMIQQRGSCIQDLKFIDLHAGVL